MKRFTVAALVLFVAGAMAPAAPSPTKDVYSHVVAEAELGQVKTPGLVPALKFTQKDFEGIAVLPKEANPGDQKDNLEFLAPRISVEIHRCKTTVEAQGGFKQRIEQQSSGFMVRVLKGPVTEIGDLRAIFLVKWNEPRDQEQIAADQLSTNSVHFTRNNVQVLVHRYGEGGEDIVALAKRLDAVIVSWVEAPKDAPAAKPAATPSAAPIAAPAKADAAADKDLPIVYRAKLMDAQREEHPQHDFMPGKEKRKTVDGFIAARTDTAGAATYPHVEVELMPSNQMGGVQRAVDAEIKGAGLSAFINYMPKEGKVSFEPPARGMVDRAIPRLCLDLADLARQLGQEKAVVSVMGGAVGDQTSDDIVKVAAAVDSGKTLAQVMAALPTAGSENVRSSGLGHWSVTYPCGQHCEVVVVLGKQELRPGDPDLTILKPLVRCLDSEGAGWRAMAATVPEKTTLEVLKLVLPPAAKPELAHYLDEKGGAKFSISYPVDDEFQVQASGFQHISGSDDNLRIDSPPQIRKRAAAPEKKQAAPVAK
jgi:hypothetical protein